MAVSPSSEGPDPKSETRTHPRAHSRRRRRTKTPPRDIARKIIIFGAADTLVSLLLPWISTSNGDINALALSANAVAAGGGMWIAVAIWLALLMAFASIMLAFADRHRNLGLVPSIAALAMGAGQIAVCGYLFATIVVLRQLGTLAFGLGGLAYIGGGALLARSPWKALPADTKSVFARPRMLPWVALSLVAVNTVVHMALAYRSDYMEIVRHVGIVGGSVVWYTPVTSLFLHADWFHLITNMAVLVAVGSAIEITSGRRLFLAVYLAGGIAGSLLSVFIDPRIHMPLVGSSSAVAGVVGLCLAYAPRQRVTIWLYAFVTIVRLTVRAAWIFSAWIALQAIGSFYLALGESDGVAYWGHLGGVIVGIASGLVLRSRRKSSATDAGRTRHAEQPARVRHARDTSLSAIPVALTAVALVISLVSAALTFTSGSLLGELASFSRAWNSGDLGRVDEHFEPSLRERHSQGLVEIMRRGDPDAPPGTTSTRIALLKASRSGGDCRAVFRVAPAGQDPYRSDSQSMLLVVFTETQHSWRVRALGEF